MESDINTYTFIDADAAALASAGVDKESINLQQWSEWYDRYQDMSGGGSHRAAPATAVASPELISPGVHGSSTEPHMTTSSGHEAAAADSSHQPSAKSRISEPPGTEEHSLRSEPCL